MDPRFKINQRYNMDVDANGIWLIAEIPNNRLREQITRGLGKYPGDMASLFATFAQKLLAIDHLIERIDEAPTD